MSIHHTYILLVGILVGCTADNKPNTAAVKEEMQQRKLMHVTESQIMAQGEVLGKEIVKEAQHSLQTALLNAIEAEGIIAAIDFCQVNAFPLVKTLEDSLNVEIKRVSQKARNPLDQPDSLENEILRAYAYDFSPANAVSQVQVLDELNLIYTHPIAIGNGLCLNCHGTPDETMTDEVYQHIQSKYPNDQAIGYTLGELRGMWSIKIPKKTVINQL